jgi:hypothetical protein
LLNSPYYGIFSDGRVEVRIEDQWFAFQRLAAELRE